MKICILTTGHSPLDDRIYYKEVLSLLNTYSSIFIIAPGTKDEFQNIRDEKVRFILLKKPSSLRQRLMLVIKGLKAVYTLKPDVVHIHDYELIFVLPILRHLLKAKIIYDVHEAYPEMALNSLRIPKIIKPLTAKIVYSCEKLFARFADVIITADDNIHSRFIEFHSNVYSIFNYPRMSLFQINRAEVEKLKQRYSGRIPIIYHGGMSLTKGLFLMLEAMEIVKRKRADIVLLLIGSMDKSLLRKVKSEIYKRDIKDNVELLGWIPHEKIGNYISICKAGLVCYLPTKKYNKNIPIKQFEYMACGIPVIGADLPPIAYYITKAGCGKLFEPGNPDFLARCIIEIIENEELWRRMSEAGISAINERWNWRLMEQKLLSIYRNLEC